MELVSTGVVRKNMIVFVVASLCGSKVGREKLYAMISSDFDTFYSLFGGVFGMLGSIIAMLISSYKTDAEADAIEGMLSALRSANDEVDSRLREADMKIKQALEKLRTKAARYNRQQAQLVAYFQ